MTIRHIRPYGLWTVALVLVISSLGLRLGYAQQPQPNNGMASMQANMATMMAEHKKMMQMTGQQDDQLQKLLAAMDAAKGEAKVDAIAAVVHALATQKMSMQHDMMTMHGQMMEQMMSMGGMMGGRGRGNQ